MNTPPKPATASHPDRTEPAVTADRLPAPPHPGLVHDWALFLDVDGTLLDFASTPESVVVPPQLKDDLAQLHKQLDGALALVSGRSIAQIDAFFDWGLRPAAGLHGSELRTGGAREFNMGEANTLAPVRKQAKHLLAGAAGIRLEDKGRALALHYRGAPGAKSQAEHIATALLEHAGSHYTLQHGNAVIELKRAGVDKGRAVQELLREDAFRARRPWMLGDDLTDEFAFRAVNESGGVSVIVGPRRPTAAHFALPDPAAVRAWLHDMATRSAYASSPPAR